MSFQLIDVVGAAENTLCIIFQYKNQKIYSTALHSYSCLQQLSTVTISTDLHDYFKRALVFILLIKEDIAVHTYI